MCLKTCVNLSYVVGEQGVSNSLTMTSDYDYDMKSLFLELERREKNRTIRIRHLVGISYVNKKEYLLEVLKDKGVGVCDKSWTVKELIRVLEGVGSNM